MFGYDPYLWHSLGHGLSVVRETVELNTTAKDSIGIVNGSSANIRIKYSITYVKISILMEMMKQFRGRNIFT